MGDKYFSERFEKAEERVNRSKKIGLMKKAYKEGESSPEKFYHVVEPFLKDPEGADAETRAHALGAANRMISGSSLSEFEKGNGAMYAASVATAAEIYDLLDRGDGHKEKIMKAYEKHPAYFSDHNLKTVKGFVLGEKPAKLENAVMGILSGVAFVVGGYLLTPSLTGNAIGNLNNSSSSFLGIVLIALAVGGFYFVSKMLKTNY